MESIGNRSGELKIRKNDDLIYIEGTTGNGYKRMIWIDWQQLSFIFHWRTSRGHVNQMYLGYVLLTNNHQISVLSDTQRSFVSCTHIYRCGSMGALHYLVTRGCSLIEAPPLYCLRPGTCHLLGCYNSRRENCRSFIDKERLWPTSDTCHFYSQSVGQY